MNITYTYYLPARPPMSRSGSSTSPALTRVPGKSRTRRLPPLLRSAWYGLNQAFRRRITHLDITPDQYTVLRNLAEAGSGGITQSELTRKMTSDPNTVASLVDRMEKAGLLHRETDLRDRRVRRLRLAPPGRRKFKSARDIAMQLQVEVLECLSSREQDHFIGILEKIADACQVAADAR